MKKKYLLIGSAGGHLTELLESLPDTFNQKEALIMTYKTKALDNSSYKIKYITNPHLSLWKYAICFIQTFINILLIRPRILISTGAGIAVPSIYLSKVFKIKLIYIESAANINTPSRTGTFAYKYADVFIVQYPSLKKHYPNAIIGRLI